uniref:Uncharacterized protein n=1 Tax=Anguilla anguilla TaxID=7936 RepID=A0A0E9T4C4_ANGAN
MSSLQSQCKMGSITHMLYTGLQYIQIKDIEYFN